MSFPQFAFNNVWRFSIYNNRTNGSVPHDVETAPVCFISHLSCYTEISASSLQPPLHQLTCQLQQLLFGQISIHVGRERIVGILPFVVPVQLMVGDHSRPSTLSFST